MLSLRVGVDLRVLAMKTVLCIPQISKASPSGGLMSYPENSLGGGSYPSAEMQSVYSTAQEDWTYFGIE